MSETQAITFDGIRTAIGGTGRRAIECRFYMTTSKASLSWNKDDEPPLLAGFDFAAAKHGTFGKATPSGSMQLQIANGTAAELLLQAQSKAIHERGANPVFRVWLVEEMPGEEE